LANFHILRLASFHIGFHMHFANVSLQQYELLLHAFMFDVGFIFCSFLSAATLILEYGSNFSKHGLEYQSFMLSLFVTKIAANYVIYSRFT